ncbi:MAG: hypothetical protein D6785_11800, partial [Planctomycetota bacterium]
FILYNHNVHSFYDINQYRTQPSFQEYEAKWIIHLNPAIICFQEFPSHEINHFIPKLQMPYFSYFEPYFSNGRSGLLILSRYPFLRKDKITDPQHMTISNYVDLIFQEDTLRIYNIHLQSYRFSQHHYQMIDSLIEGEKTQEKILIKESKKLYLYYTDEEDSSLRVLDLYDEEYFLENQEDIHPAFLEEIKLQTSDRIQIPITFYRYLGFSKEHRFALVTADTTGSYYRIFNLAMIAYNLPEHEELGRKLPSFIEINAAYDKKLNKYLNTIVYLPQGGFRPGYEWLAQRLSASMQQQNGLPPIHSLPSKNGNVRTKPQTPPPFHPSPLFEANGKEKVGKTLRFPFE